MAGGIHPFHMCLVAIEVSVLCIMVCKKRQLPTPEVGNGVKRLALREGGGGRELAPEPGL